MKRSDRLLALVQILRRRRRPVTAGALAGELGVSERTIYRDMDSLLAAGAPVRGEAGVGYVLDAGYDLPPMMFTPDEIEAILVGMNWLAGRGDTALARAAEDVVAKVGVVLPERLRPLLFEGALFAPDMGRARPVDGIDVSLLRGAIRAGLKATIVYADGAGATSERVIWPFGLAYFDAARVVIAWCELRGDFRHFRTDRITSLTVGAKYPARRADLLRRWEREARDRPRPSR